MRSRLIQSMLVCLTLGLATGCSTPVGPGGGFGPPPFPPDLDAQVTTESGLVFSATGEIVSTGPTVIRVTATVENPTGAELVVPTLADACELIVVVSWESSPFVRIADPPDGGGSGPGALGNCGGQTASRTFAAGETVELVSGDIVLSELLRSTFVPGARYVFSAIYVDLSIYEVLALDTTIDD